MKLFVEFNDVRLAEVRLAYTGEFNVHRRIVEVVLTPEQEDLLLPRTIGEANGQQLLEDMRVICLQ